MIQSSEIAKALSEDRSKRTVMILVDQMAKENFDLNDFLAVVKSSPLPLKWHMTWTLNHYYDQYPHVPPKQQRSIWDFLLETEHEGMLRDLWRIISIVNLDEDIAGEAFEKALHIVPSQMQPIAIRAHAMQVLLNTVKMYPELSNEYMLVLEELDADPSVAIQARARLHRNRIKKLQRL